MGVGDIAISNNLFTNFNTLDNSDFFAITFTGPGLNGSYTISSNTISNPVVSINEAAGISFILGSSSSTVLSDSCVVSITDNKIDIREGQGIEFDIFGSSQANVTIAGNAIYTEAKAAVDLAPANTSSANFTIFDNTITEPNSLALSMSAKDGAKMDAVVFNNLFINSKDGFEFGAGGGGADKPLNLVVLNAFNNQFQNNMGSDFEISTDAAPHAACCVTLTNNYAPALGFIFDKGTGSILNLNKFEGNVGPISITGDPITENSTCP